MRLDLGERAAKIPICARDRQRAREQRLVGQVRPAEPGVKAERNGGNEREGADRSDAPTRQSAGVRSNDRRLGGLIRRDQPARRLGASAAPPRSAAISPRATSRSISASWAL